jgi:hypothetical protein
MCDTADEGTYRDCIFWNGFSDLHDYRWLTSL